MYLLLSLQYLIFHIRKPFYNLAFLQPSFWLYLLLRLLPYFECSNGLMALIQRRNPAPIIPKINSNTAFRTKRANFCNLLLSVCTLFCTKFPRQSLKTYLILLPFVFVLNKLLLLFLSHFQISDKTFFPPFHLANTVVPHNGFCNHAHTYILFHVLIS